MQADDVQNAKEPIAAQIDLSGQTLNTKFDNEACFAMTSLQSKPWQSKSWQGSRAVLELWSATGSP